MAGKVTILDAAGFPISHDGSRLLTVKSATRSWSARELIRHAQEHPPEPIIEGLFNVGDVLLLHGSEESFKSIFVLQMAESIALGRPLIGCWNVPKARRVGLIETEIHEVMLGERLSKMFPNGDPPEGLCFMGEDALRDWRRKTMDQKFQFVQDWMNEEKVEVLMIDIASDFFRGPDNPSEERAVGKFFDELRNLRTKARAIVRHDRKKKAELDGEVNANERIRGSAEWKEDPEVILSLERPDRRTNEVALEVGKLRYGLNPEPFKLWFDVGTFRLTPLPPVIAVLQAGKQARRQIVVACKERFGLGERTVDDMLGKEREFLVERQEGHKKSFEIDAPRALGAPWSPFFFGQAVEG